MILIVLPDIEEEDRLLVAARGGNQAAILQIYELYFPPVYQYIRLRVGERPLAEDLASEVFTQMLEAFRGASAPQKSLRGWLFRVARFTLHDHYTKTRKVPIVELDDWMGDESAESLEQEMARKLELEEVRQALKTLKPEYQEVLILRFGQLLSVQEAADIMGKNVGALKVLQVRALQQLRSRLIETAHRKGA